MQTGRAGFEQLAAEFGLRHYDAVHERALWAIDQLDATDRAGADAAGVPAGERTG